MGKYFYFACGAARIFYRLGGGYVGFANKWAGISISFFVRGLLMRGIAMEIVEVVRVGRGAAEGVRAPHRVQPEIP